MKCFHSQLSKAAPFIFFPMVILFVKHQKIFYILFSFLIISLSSCYLNFYRTNTKYSIDPATASKLQTEKKYFIIHFLNSTKGLENVSVLGDSLYGKIVPLPFEHSKYLYPVPTNPKNRLKAIDKKAALVEVHLYTTQALKDSLLTTDDSLFVTALSSFNRLDVYELNRQATSTNHILSTVGVVLTVGAIVGLIVAATSTPDAPPPSNEGCNCPQLFINNNNGEYRFISGLYSGAVYSTLERTDYFPFTAIPSNTNKVAFKIANDEDEEQFINTVSLISVNHSADENILIDRHGEILSYSNRIAPLVVKADENNDIKSTLLKTDDTYYSFNNNANNDGFSDLELIFNKPVTATNAKLIIHARNTFWGGLLHKEFLGLFGENLQKWRVKQEKADPKKLEKWQTEQALPLMVYLKTGKQWKFIDYFPLIGNTASRDMIMKINTNAISGDKIELKLQTAYRFWDLDLVAIDYSPTENFTTTIIEPEEAIKSDNTDQKEILENNDAQYAHLMNDEFISFKYSIPAATEAKVSSYFLVSGGYYHNLEQLTGKANYKELVKFKKKGAFDRFSREKYQQALNLAKLLNNYPVK
ncbi:MAG: hypothetical protein ACTHJ5_09780 [Ilyomonas sp.]